MYYKNEIQIVKIKAKTCSKKIVFKFNRQDDFLDFLLACKKYKMSVKNKSRVYRYQNKLYLFLDIKDVPAKMIHLLSEYGSQVKKDGAFITHIMEHSTL